MEQDIRYRHTTNVHNLKAAEEMVPIMMKLFSPASVVDVGCGLGSWLKVFQDAGIDDITGYDGGYVDIKKLYIDPSRFVPVDLELPIPVSRRADLALCLEVAEHLKITAAETLVNSLVGLSDTIIFSAAIPGQGGQNHINEQWPDWWAELFAKKGYYFYDVFRQRFWNNPNIEWWYRQNMYLVTTPEKAAAITAVKAAEIYIHPELYEQKLRRISDYENGRISLLAALAVIKNTFKRLITGKASGKP
jgi:hypothetical protein